MSTPHLLALTPARPFFCAGGVGRSASYLLPLAEALGPGQPFYALELPGLDGVSEPLDTVEEIAATFIDEIRVIQPHGPYRLGGHSFGGVLAYEMGRQLRAAGAQVEPVVVLDGFVAVEGQSTLAGNDLMALSELLVLRHLICDADGRCSCRVDQTKPLSEQHGQVARALGARDPERYEDHVVRLLGVYHAALVAHATYAPPPSDLTVHLVATEHGVAPLRDEDHRVRMYLDSSTNGWEHVELGELRVEQVSGGHVSMFLPPHVNEVGAVVRAAFNR